MTRTECNKLIVAMMALYSRHYQDPEGALRTMCEPWYMVMCEYSYAEANTALAWFARADNKGFPPAPGQIVDYINRAHESQLSGYVDEGKAWDLCYKAMRDANYHAEDRFAELPELIRRAIGSPEALRQMASEVNVNVTKGIFINAYRNVILRARSEATAPMVIREKMEQERIPERGARVAQSAWIETRDGGMLELGHTGEGWAPGKPDEPGLIVRETE